MPENIKPLLYFVKEREAIRIKKEAGQEPPPYTSDPILATFRFCNVHRRNDKVSQWILNNALTRGNRINYPLENFLMFAALCRWINWPPTIKAIMDAGLYPQKTVDWKKIGRLLDKRGETEKVWTGAYMIRAPGEKGAKKGSFVATEVIGKHYKRAIPGIVIQITEGATFQGVWKAIREAQNFGSFMAGQVAGDLTYTSLLRRAPDINVWAPMGPGSIRGFNRLMGVTDKKQLSRRPSEELWLEKLAKWRAAIIKQMGPAYQDLTAMDVQNCLCETDKYLRFERGEGRPRAKYVHHDY